ncbi:MAG TPA: hypothetical protein VEB59_04250 [Gemmatimonadales bacterium]|nr:hypothetical protein [Gemmatimonadales bacterium]
MPPRILLLAALLGGCAGAAPPSPVPEPERPADACLLERTPTGGEGASPVAPTATAAASEPADTGLLSPARLRTPIGLDCTGRPVPRLARSWSSTFGGRNWTLVVPSSAALASAWRGTAAASAVLRQAGVTSYVPLDDHRLVVSLDAPYATIPRLFADPALAAGAVADSTAGSSGQGDSARFRRLPPLTDLRDAVDQGAGLVITGDPAVAEYAERRGGYAAHPLPWNRTYVLLVPGSGEDFAVPDSAVYRDALARDAVRTWARGASGDRWWEGAACDRPTPARPAVAGAVVYPASDPVARSLAERIVATSRSVGVTRGVADGQLGPAIARGLGNAFVVPLPLVPLVPCRAVAAWPEGARVLPLVDTRRIALIRAGVGPFRVDHDGGIIPPESP